MQLCFTLGTYTHEQGGKINELFRYFSHSCDGYVIYGSATYFTALGGVFSERSGVVNIALEGLMLFGAFIGIVTTLLMGDTRGSMTPWIALLFAAIGSGLFALLHAVASITFRADQVVSGVAINFLALGLTVFAIKKIFGKGQTDFIQYRIEKIDVPGL